jgi:hypothetical protein
MKEKTELEKLKEDAAKAAGFDTEQREKGYCIKCRQPARPRCYSQAGFNEYAITGICEVCFDDLFGHGLPDAH